MHTSHDAFGTSVTHQDASVNHIMLWINSFLFLVAFWSSYDLRIYNRKIYYEPHPVSLFQAFLFVLRAMGKMLFWVVSGFGCNTREWPLEDNLITLYISASPFVMCQLFLLLQQRASAFISTSLSWVITFPWVFGSYFVPYDFFFFLLRMIFWSWLLITFFL